ncbi:DUF4352 domain-containing protein [Corynebacterium sp. p3-SID1056]|uniref:DUF4352 domain-containing protein n=1 Tax=Corynebacterium sp. p3-SID1056 TaxID=2916092 RepID=UPI0021A6E7C5|nr:DUF4352 domain-containing protein [Corynebacterium sp. p3-SID1056]MCT2338020.1 DUF4352 domain-containing protein [Corynebacterium sp. p3-SID1056]
MSTAYPGPQGGQNYDGTASSENPTSPANQQVHMGTPYGAPMHQGVTDQSPNKERNIIGIIGLVCAILGVIFSCIPGALIIGWILLPIAFILGIVGLFPKGKKKGTAIASVIISIVGAIVAAVAFVFVVDNAFNEALNKEPTVSNNGDVSNESSEGANLKSGSGKSSDGESRDNPLPIGTTISSDEWDVTVNSVNLAATDAVLAENEFNEAPAEGQTYIMANVTATYKGDDPQGSSPFFSIAYVTPQGNEIDGFDNIAVVPDEFDNLSPLYEDASTTGNFSFLVDEATAGEGLLAVAPDMFSQKRFVSVN